MTKAKKKKVKKMTEEQKRRIAASIDSHMTRHRKYKRRHADHVKQLQQFFEAVYSLSQDQSLLVDEAEADKWANEFADAVWPRGSVFDNPRPLFFLFAEMFFDTVPKGQRITRAQLLLGTFESIFYALGKILGPSEEESNWDHDNENGNSIS